MMAGITRFPFSPPALLSPPPPAATTSNPAKSLLSSSFLVRSSKNQVQPLQSRSVSRAAVSRYGGGGGYRPSGGSSRRTKRDNRVADSDYDAALDLDLVQSNSVRLLDEQQNMIGVMSKSEAIQRAEDAELLLAILSVDADPPVLRLFDSGEYKKHKYEQQKKKRVQQKRSAASRVDIKELKMGYNIDSHDYSVRLRAAQRFLKDGDKVKIIVNLKGRENEFRNIAIELIKRFQNEVGELATEESKNFNDRNIFIIMTPNKAVLQKAQEQSKKKETAKEVSAGV